MAKVNFWSKSIEDILAQRSATVSDDLELFIQIEGDDCAYYFVDHSTRTEFWLEAFSTEDLNMFPVVSPSHLSMFLHITLPDAPAHRPSRTCIRRALLVSYRTFPNAPSNTLGD